MLKKALTILLLTLILPVFAEESAGAFMDELEALAELQATDVLQQSVEGYYQKNTDIDQGKYPTLLHDAAIMGATHLLEYLTKHDPHGVNYAYENGPTPLGYIAGDNQIASAEILLNAGADPDDVGDTDGIFPLASAVTSGNMQMIQLLLKYNAQVHIGAYYQSPLGLTLEKNDIETLQLFDNYKFKLDSMDDELRILVTEYLNSDFVEEDVLKILKVHGFDIYEKTEEKASFLTEYGKKVEHSDVLKMLQDLYEVTTSSADAEIADVEEDAASVEESGVVSKEVEDTADKPMVDQQEQGMVENTELAPTETTECLENQDNIVENEETLTAVDTCKEGTNSGLADDITSDKNIDSSINSDDNVSLDPASADNKQAASTQP